MPQVFSFLLFGGSNLVKVQIFLFFGEFLGGLRKVLRKKKKKKHFISHNASNSFSKHFVSWIIWI